MIREDAASDADRIIHFTLSKGMVRGLFVVSTNTVQKAQQIHESTPVCTAALGRLMTGTSMIGCQLKDDRASVTVTIEGGGPMGRLLCVGDTDSVRVDCDDPQVTVQNHPSGKLNVGAAVGAQGHMCVVKDLLLKSPYIGQTALVSGEIGEDFAMYFTSSEQSPSLVSLGVLVKGSEVLAAGGLLLQPLPDCEDSVIDQLELRSPIYGDLSTSVYHDKAESLISQWFDGLSPVILETTPLCYRCACSRERMERALISLGEKELKEMIQDEIDGAELKCHFCHKMYSFTTHDLIKLLNRATSN